MRIISSILFSSVLILTGCKKESNAVAHKGIEELGDKEHLLTSSEKLEYQMIKNKASLTSEEEDLVEKLLEQVRKREIATKPVGIVDSSSETTKKKGRKPPGARTPVSTDSTEEASPVVSGRSDNVKEPSNVEGSVKVIDESIPEDPKPQQVKRGDVTSVKSTSYRKPIQNERSKTYVRASASSAGRVVESRESSRRKPASSNSGNEVPEAPPRISDRLPGSKPKGTDSREKVATPVEKLKKILEKLEAAENNQTGRGKLMLELLSLMDECKLTLEEERSTEETEALKSVVGKYHALLRIYLKETLEGLEDYVQRITAREDLDALNKRIEEVESHYNRLHAWHGVVVGNHNHKEVPDIKELADKARQLYYRGLDITKRLRAIEILNEMIDGRNRPNLFSWSVSTQQYTENLPRGAPLITNMTEIKALEQAYPKWIAHWETRIEECQRSSDSCESFQKVVEDIKKLAERTGVKLI